MTDHKLEIILSAKNMATGAFDSIGAQVTNLTRTFSGLQGAMAAAAGVAGFGLLVKGAIDSTAEIKRNAEMAGVSAEAYQELTYAAKQYQVTADALTDGLKELNLRADEFAVTGAGSAAEAFQRLGYTQEEVNAKLSDTPGLLLEITDRIQGLGRAAQIRIADELFGGQGGEQFVAMLRAGSGEIERLRDRARSLGLVLDSHLVDQAAEAKAKLDTLVDVLGVQFKGVLVTLAPSITNVADRFTTWIEENQNLIDQNLPQYIESLGSALEGAAGVAARLAGYIAKIASVGAQFEEFHGIMERAGEYARRGLFDFSQLAGLDTDAALAKTREIVEMLDRTVRITENGEIRYKIGVHTEGFEKFKADYEQWIASLHTTDKTKPVAPLPLVPALPTPPPVNVSSNTADWVSINTPGDEADQGYSEIEELLSKRNELFQTKNDELTGMTERTAWAMQENFSNLFYDAMTGKLDSFEDYASSIFDSIVRAWSDMIGQMAAKAIANNIIGGMFSTNSTSVSLGTNSQTGALANWGAKGLVYDRHGIKWHASGDILSSPTVFPLTNGQWIGAGEAGTEAIMPLRRGADGRLGVEANGSKNNTVVNVYNSSGVEARTEERDGPGGLEIDVIIDRAFAQKIAQRGSVTEKTLRMQTNYRKPLTLR
ncbi:hypothetical protein [Desulfatitalea tepidiphila]|uniref:hypothetical protein n=1 Tax=Desulfatitalea tepidiphila TaxID=1185843 RepID=UPI0006B53711|nr:hypothetical protein [Desulfatitalea tepidiphila]